MSRVGRALSLVCALSAWSCGGPGSAAGVTGPSAEPTPVSDDAALFRLVSQGEPSSSYRLFPNVDEFTDGRLVGSEAHRPVVRVSANSTTLEALVGGRLPAGTNFPAGSVIFKEVRSRVDANPTTYAVMYKAPGQRLAANGWIWAEFSPSGSVIYSVSNQGRACTSCHLLEEGPRHDSVRTFERQR